MSSSSCYVYLMGGIGNQLFEIAAGYAHARKTERTLQLAERTSCKRPTYWRTFLHKLADKTAAAPPGGMRLWREPHFHYVEIPQDATGLYGYFQSSRYFVDVSGEIRDMFDPHSVIKAVVAEKYADLLTKETDACVVHVRRTDYLQGENVAFHAVCDKAWYVRALAEMDRRRAGKPTRYLVFSDDLDWCRSSEQADLWSGRDVTFVDEPDDCVALHLMSQFGLFVIPNSTFSWWAAWLSTAAAETKTVIVPDRWFGPAGPQDWQDIYEPDWIRVA